MISQLSTVLFSIVFFIACGSDVQRPDGIILFEDDNTFIELVSVEDSRCPSDVTCIWAGNAAVLLRIHQNDTQQEFGLNSNPGENTGVGVTELLGYRISLIDVSPFPTSDTAGTIELEDYVVELDVTS